MSGRSDYEVITDVILHGKRPCCDSTADVPHQDTCRHSPKGAVAFFRQQTADRLQTCVGEGVLLPTDTVEAAIAKLMQ